MARRAGQIIKRGENRYLVRIYLGPDATGKRRYHNHTIRGTKKDADRWLTAALRRLDLGEPVEQSGELAEVFLDRWLEGAVKQRTSERTYEHHKSMVNIYLKPAFYHRRLSDLNASDITTLLASMREKGLSSRTQLYVFSLLKNAFKQAVRWQLLRANPCDLVDAPRQQSQEQKAMTKDEVKAFLGAVQGQRYELAFILAFTLGARPGEYLGLKWSDLDMAHKTITIQRALVWRKTKDWYLKEPKTARSRRKLPLTDELLKRLAQHRRNQQEMRLKAGSAWKHQDFIFTDDFGQPVSMNALRYDFQRALKAAGLSEDFRLYDTRHSAATFMMAQGINPKVVSERLGHSDISITLRVYSHVLPTMQQEASELMERAFLS